MKDSPTLRFERAWEGLHVHIGSEELGRGPHSLRFDTAREQSLCKSLRESL